MKKYKEAQMIELRPFNNNNLYEWNPQRDITAYELAILSPLFRGHSMDIESILDAEPGLRRHVKEV